MIDKDNEIHLLKSQILYWQQKYEKLKIEHEEMIKEHKYKMECSEKYTEENYVSKYMIDKAMGRDI